jgi:hypothetical protein
MRWACSTSDGAGIVRNYQGFAHEGIKSAVDRIMFISDRISYIILRGLWCDIIVLNVRAPREDKINDVKVRFYENLLELVFDKFLKYHKISVENFNIKVKKLFSNQQLGMRV